MNEIAGFLVFPAIAAAIFVVMHTWLGLHVLRRNVVFADLALAQLAALGAAMAVAAGHPPAGTAGFSYAVFFAGCGAVVLTILRSLPERVSQEAVIGVLYVVATALTVLVVDASPQGAEHVKKMLVGSILVVGRDEVAELLVLYGAIGIVHFAFRRQLLAASDPAAPGRGVMRGVFLWDLVFYASFAVVVTSSVRLAGVLLVFSFLIIPAVIGSLYCANAGRALAIGCAAGIAASLAGFAAAVAYDVPTGAVLVASFGATLIVAALLKTRAKIAGLGAACLLSSAVLAQGAWIIAAPAADQPLLALLERTTPLRTDVFLDEAEREQRALAAVNEERHSDAVERLRELERASRWQGEPLTEEQVQVLGAHQKAYSEMARGERFVQDHLRVQARIRGRWLIGLPTLAVGLVALFAFAATLRRALRR
ncbi:MAG: metal ABC transporter permease [Betaproteobacteria bacterium]